ncbi:SAM-dependent methyltransferase|nr:SAM-dependent methyltransferase [Candidatus Bathyarchaeota archaeon]
MLENEKTWCFFMENHSKKEEHEEIPVQLTARLMAHYRAMERHQKEPLLVDPLARRLAGNMNEFIEKHQWMAARGDYPIVRSHFIEHEIMPSWCHEHRDKKGQIVLLGAGFDTRAYRFTDFSETMLQLFEVDIPSILNYKEEFLEGETPLLPIVRVGCDLASESLPDRLITVGYANDHLTLWIFEGLLYYLERPTATRLLQDASSMSIAGSKLFVDTCVPGYAHAEFGVLKHFKWGLEFDEMVPFFSHVGWDVRVFHPEEYEPGKDRDTGQRGMAFIVGSKKGRRT